MDFKSKIIKTKYIHELQDPECFPEKSSDSLQTTNSDSKITSSTLSPKKSRRSIQKKVIIVPINDGDCSRVKGEMTAPPSDSWAWRKYGQKPIKGSPFPRGYYKCSSTKGCPARKQVEKSREDPNMLVIVYYSDHNHPCPPPRKSNNQNKLCNDDDEEQDEDFQKLTNHVSQSDHNIVDSKFTYTGMAASEGTFITSRANDYGSCFSDYDDGVYSTTMLEVPFFTFDEMTMMYTIRHEDEEIFADLDELPECSTVFHRRKMEIEEERRRQSLIS